MARQANEPMPPDWGIENRDLRLVPRPACPLCGVGGHPLYRDLVDTVAGAPGRWNVSRCPNPACGLLWLDPAPPVSSAAVAQRRDSIDTIVGCLRGQTPGRLLDVSCGDGATIARMRELGWDAEGVDPDLGAVEAARARGLRVAHGTLAAQGYPDERFDAVTLIHSIEHVHDPRAEVEECFRVMAPGGRLVIETPNAAAWCHRLLGAAWRGLEPPRHLQVFTLGTLARLAREAGFHVERLRSTAKAAGFYWSESMDPGRARRAGASADQWSSGTALMAALGAASEAVLLALVPDVGEELVMVAVKPAVVREKLVEREEEVRSAPMLAPETAG